MIIKPSKNIADTMINGYHLHNLGKNIATTLKNEAQLIEILRHFYKDKKGALKHIK
jgi:hypothetical protein